jgi:hypothetical protein
VFSLLIEVEQLKLVELKLQEEDEKELEVEQGLEKVFCFWKLIWKNKN